MDSNGELYTRLVKPGKHSNSLDEESGRTSAKNSLPNRIASITASFTVVVTVVYLVTLQLGSSERSRSFLATTETWKPQTCTPMAVSVPRVEDLTLDEKIGQMTQVDQLAVTKSIGNGDDIAKYFIGSVLSGGGGAPQWGNTAPDWAALVDHLQSKVSHTRLQIPLLYGIDAVHGNNNVYGTTIFPHHVALGATRDPDLVRQVGAAAARETAAVGVRWAFSPAVSVCRDPRWGRCYESFSEQTEVVTAVASAEIEGWQTRPSPDPTDPASSVPGSIFVAATAKHFIGDGGTTQGTDQGNTVISDADLRRVHLPPYIEAVQRGVQTVMISYSSINGMKMHGNHHLITDVLKEEIGFGGVVVSDWEAIQQLPGNFSDQVRESVNAGIDVIMVPFAYKEFIATLKGEVEAGRVSHARIDDAVRRVLKLKENLGLFEDACSQKSLLPEVGKAEHRAVARRAVQESLVLLKNERREKFPAPETEAGAGAGVGRNARSMFPLPLTATTKILVAGSHADDIGLQCGGWTVKWQGAEGNITIGTTILEGIKDVVEKEGASVEYVRQPTGAEEADFGIVVVGERPYAEFHGDDPALQLGSSSGAAIHAVCRNMPCVVVLISGRAIQVDYLLPKIDALVAAWLPGSEGNGVADVLFGSKEFTGTLPVTWFSDTSMLPMNVDNAVYEPLFPLGFGLTKTGIDLGDGTFTEVDASAE